MTGGSEFEIVASFNAYGKSPNVKLLELTMAEPPHTDVSRPSALPTANLRITSNASQSIVDQNSAEYLEQIEEEWNKKVDVEVETLVDGMVDLVSLASVSTRMKLRLLSDAD